MVRHIILWKLNDTLNAEEAAAAKAEVKARLEALNGVVPGLLSLSVVTEGLASSNADMMLDSSFPDEAALAGYQVHPAHQAAAGFVRSVVSQRLCLDFEA